MRWRSQRSGVESAIGRELRRHALALISLGVALTSVSYNTWRNERTEYTCNVRAACFQLLRKLADFERAVFLAQYDRDTQQGSPRIGWSDVIVIHDLTSVAPAPLELKVAALRTVWRENWEHLGDADESSVDIEAAIEDLRQVTLRTPRDLH